MPALKNHVHTYERSKKNKRIYRCVHPDCTSYSHVDDLRGKRAKCKCGREFILETRIDRHFRKKELKCDLCLGKITETIQAVIEQAAQDAVLPDVLHDLVLAMPELPESSGLEEELDGKEGEGI